MRKITLAVFALLLMFSVAAVAQDQGQTSGTEKKEAKAEKKQAKAEKQEAKAASKNKAMHLTGWVKTEGDKVTFVNDKDKQTWNVSNPDTVKQYEGKHVRVKATLNESDKSINVESAKELRKGKQAKEAQEAPKS